mmetsp:Transcript_97079/g.256544  ORF Transcript_97079/g.256544 Transcript_97079/m.256544 type:complete len:216 (+) Transcript_97079:1317-1964(+)
MDATVANTRRTLELDCDMEGPTPDSPIARTICRSSPQMSCFSTSSVKVSEASVSTDKIYSTSATTTEFCGTGEAMPFARSNNKLLRTPPGHISSSMTAKGNAGAHVEAAAAAAAAVAAVEASQAPLAEHTPRLPSPPLMPEAPPPTALPLPPAEKRNSSPLRLPRSAGRHLPLDPRRPMDDIGGQSADCADAGRVRKAIVLSRTRRQHSHADCTT